MGQFFFFIFYFLSWPENEDSVGLLMKMVEECDKVLSNRLSQA